MPNRQFTYRVNIDTASAQRAAAQMRTIFQNALGNVQVGAGGRGSGQGGSGGGRRGFHGGNLLDANVGRMLTGGLVGFSAMQVGRATLELGKHGAEVTRITRSYHQLAGAIGLNADALTGKMRAAVQGTVSDYDMLSRANLLLVSAQQGALDITEDQIAALAEFARLRSTQLTLEGKNMSTQEAFSRLIRGIAKRETELLDELGISSKQMADILGISVKEVNSSVQSMLNSVLAVAEQDLSSFGDPIVDEAARIEQSMAQIENAKNKLAQSFSKPIAVVMTVVADLIAGTGDTGTPFTEGTVGALRAALEEALKKELEGAMIAATQGTLTASQVRSGSTLGTPGTSAFRSHMSSDNITKILFMQQELIENFQDLEGQARLFQGPFDLDDMKDVQQVFVDVLKVYSEIRRQDGLISPGAVAAADAFLTNFVSGFINGQIKIDAANQSLGTTLLLLGQIDTAARFFPSEGFAQSLEELMEAIGTAQGDGSLDIFNSNSAQPFIEQGQAIDQLTGTLDAIKGAGEMGAEGLGEIEKALVRISLEAIATGSITKQQITEIAALSAQFLALIPRDQSVIFGPRVNPGIASGQPTNSEDLFLKIQNDFGVAAENVGKRWEQEAVRAGKEAEKAFESAAKAAEAAWQSGISSIQGIPGVSGASEITQQDLDRAAQGLSIDFTDNFTRRMNDELVNGVDWPEVTRGLVEKIVSATRGIPMAELAGVSDEVLAGLATEDISSGAVFGTEFGRQITTVLINEEALVKDARYQGLVQIGTEYVSSYAQAVLEAVGVDFANKENPLTKALINDFIQPKTNVAGLSIDGLKGQFEDGKVQEKIKSLGASVAEGMNVGFGENILEQPWAFQISAAIKADILRELNALFNNE